MKNDVELGELLKGLPSNILDTLVPREKVLLVQLYGLEGEQAHSYKEVAEIHGVTISRIKQIEAKALKKLRYRKEFYEHKKLEEDQGKHY